MITIKRKKVVTPSEISQLKKEMKDYYNTYLKGKTVKNKEKGINVVLSGVGRNHVLYARAVGFEKLIAIKKLPAMIREAEFCSFNEPDDGDSKDILGYMNFKANICINEEVLLFQIVVRFTKNGKFFYDHSVRIEKG